MSRLYAPLLLVLLTAATASAAGDCPERVRAPARLPGAAPAHETLAYWLALAGDPDAVLAGADALAAHDVALRRDPDDGPRLNDLTRQPGRGEVVRAVHDRLSWYRRALETGAYRTGRPTAVAELAAAAGPRDCGGAGCPEGAAPLEPGVALRVAVAPVPLRCVPFPDAIRSPNESPTFDRNSCGLARPQDAVEILGRLGRMRLARTRLGFGFVGDDAALSPPVPPEFEATWRQGPPLVLRKALKLGGRPLPAGTLLKSAGDGAAWIAGPRGFSRSRPLTAREVSPARRPLTRRALLSEAFRRVGRPYGWGDEGGGIDCSRLVLDVFATFGLTMPRTSASQSRAGLETVDVPAAAGEAERLALLDAAHARGVVLLHFPGHIMLYLGRDRDGVPRALHALAEYAAPCPGGGETVFEVGRVVVTDLELGRGTSRRSFLERATRLAVFTSRASQHR